MTTFIYVTASLATEGWCELYVDPEKFEKSVVHTIQANLLIIKYLMFCTLYTIISR